MSAPPAGPVAAAADALLAELAPYDVVAAQTLGRDPGLLLPRLAPADFAARQDAARRAAEALAATEVSPAERVLAAALRERLASDLALDDVGWTTSLVAPLATPAHAIRQVFDGWSGDDEALAANLAAVPAAYRDWTDTLRSSPRQAPRRQLAGAAAQCRSWRGYYDRLVAGKTLQPLADAATEATERFADALDELALSAPQTDAVGRDFYGITSSAFLGETVDLDETYAWGWSELERLTAEMSVVAGRLGHDSVEAAAAALDAGPRVATADLEAWLADRLAAVADAVDGVHLDLPAASRLPVAALDRTAAGVMYYAPPDAAFTRPGTVWWAPPAEGSVATWHEVTTVHHEGIPGHHLQIATAMAEPGLHPWQRTMVHVHGYAEGWAHYAELLADEFGLLRDDGERLGMLFGQRWRAARIVIDLGLHLGLPLPRNGFTAATAWSPEVGREVLVAAARCDATTARFEVERYLGWPGQALAFRVGARLWQQLRARTPLPPRDFHSRALRLGPMGLGPLREVLG